jgi:hypothetical protein
MSVQVIHDGKGRATGVYIPINEWEALKKRYEDLESMEVVEPSKEQVLSELAQAIKELALIEEGKLKARPAKELLNEL